MAPAVTSRLKKKYTYVFIRLCLWMCWRKKGAPFVGSPILFYKQTQCNYCLTIVTARLFNPISTLYLTHYSYHVNLECIELNDSSNPFLPADIHLIRSIDHFHPSI